MIVKLYGEGCEWLDRHFHHLKSHEHFTVEYKTDHTAARTGNAFIDTVSVDMEQKVGWAFTSQAGRLLYFIRGKQVVYLLKMVAIRAQLPSWMQTYEVRLYLIRATTRAV